MDISDIFSIIDEFDSSTFEACRETLYRHLNFKVLKIVDVRPVDIKEKIEDFFDRYMNGRKIKNQFEISYAMLIENIMDLHIEPKSERDSRYRQLASKCVCELKNGTGDISTLENLVLVYICQFREYKKLSAKSNVEEILSISGTEYLLSSGDVHVVDYIYNMIKYCTREPQKLLIGKIKEKKRELSYFEKQLLYIITILIAYRILQYEG